MTADAPKPYFADGMPLPAQNLHTRPFWDACREHRLLIQCCVDCGIHRSPPKPLCARCGSFAASGEASLVGGWPAVSHPNALAP